MRMKKKNTIKVIAWDLHGVLFVKSIWHWFFLIITFSGIFKAIWKMSFSGYKLIFKYVLRKLGLYQKEITNEELIKVCVADGNDQMITLIKKVSCDYVPYKEVIALVKKIHSRGIQQDIVSNIGQTVFADFKQLYPEIFIYFKNVLTVNIQPGRVVLKKPDVNYFKAYVEMYQYRADEIIFIDDNSDNVRSAEKIGIFALNFQSAALLQKDFDRLNLF
jgi:FMN phosphatase YigB (HAD superfamily)